MNFPENCQFIYPWRSYQQKLLDELESHLEDEQLHLIAPPGSGKTVVGLEIAIRFNQPTLILAPTLAIRNQWILRLCELFLQVKEIPDWISTEIRNPKFLTVSTYQGLHSALKNEKLIEKDEEEWNDSMELEEIEEIDVSENFNPIIIDKLKKIGVKVLIADEAHHLKNAWWRSLNHVKNNLNPKIVGLTATPPFDVSGSEWNRYIDFNGPVDAEISVAELVKNGDLCPHQDFVYFSFPNQDELIKLKNHHDKIQELFFELSQDKNLIEVFENHPLWLNPLANLEWIYSNLEIFSSILIFLHYNKKEIPPTYLEIFGQEKITIPSLDFSWLEVLLNYFLNSKDEYFLNFIELKEKLKNELKRKGAIERNKVSLFQTYKTRKFLSRSVTKLSSIYNIFTFEHENLGNKLRMVILTDFIRKEYLEQAENEPVDLNKMGVIPIFETIRRNYNQPISIAVLTGTTVILPFSILSIIKEEFGAELSFKKLNFDENYVEILSSTHQNDLLIHWVTELFNSGKIQLIIGTKSLLGEGWDAPAINTLVMASFVSSFVTSNQMRGRAIRVYAKKPNKVANIWHLVSIDPTQYDLGEDFVTMQKRFKTFIGVSYAEPLVIENGIKRFNFLEDLKKPENLNLQNQYTFSIAKKRSVQLDNWKNALDKGTSMIEEIKIPFAETGDFSAIKSLYYNKTIKHFFTIVLSGIALFLSDGIAQILAKFFTFRSTKEIVIAIFFTVIMAMLFFGINLFKSIKLYIKYRDISKDIHGIGKALLQTLMDTKMIESKEDLKVETQVNNRGEIFCHLEGANRYESSLFMQSLEEILNPVENPRYILIRKSKIFALKKQSDYHNVPEVLAVKKKFATLFAENWQKLVGDNELIYTRNLEGRKTLLKARFQSLSAKLDENYEPVNVWK